MDKRSTPEELIHNDDYIAWLRAGSPDKSDWHTWSSKSENAKAHETASAFIESITLEDEEDPQPVLDQLWTKIEAQTIKKESIEAATSKVRSISWLSIAASIALLLGALGWIFNANFSGKVVSADLAETKVMDLPDGSTVILNAGSQIKYYPKKWEKEREVKLVGEAFFEVVGSDQKFMVKTKSAQIEVLGTSFNVYDREEESKVQCYTGKVKVIMDDEENVLKKGQTVSMIANRRPNKGNFDPQSETWREGAFSYINQELSTVCDELERQYKVRITLDEDLHNVRYTGTFRNGDLEKALQAICWPLKLEHEIDGDKIMIFNNLND